MKISINDPTVSQAYLHVVNNSHAVSTELTRMATAQKINSAADDAVHLVIGTKLEAESRALAQMNANAQDRIGAIDTTLSEIETGTDETLRARDEAIREGDGDAVAALDAEFEASITQHADMSQERSALTRTIEFQSERQIHVEAARSRTIDADMARVSVDLATASIKQNTSILAQVHAQTQLQSFLQGLSNMP